MRTMSGIHRRCRLLWTNCALLLTCPPSRRSLPHAILESRKHQPSATLFSLQRPFICRLPTLLCGGAPQQAHAQNQRVAAMYAACSPHPGSALSSKVARCWHPPMPCRRPGCLCCIPAPRSGTQTHATARIGAGTPWAPCQRAQSSCLALAPHSVSCEGPSRSAQGAPPLRPASTENGHLAHPTLGPRIPAPRWDSLATCTSTTFQLRLTSF